MSEEKRVRAHLEFGETRVEFEGDADQVLESILRFLSEVYPSIEVIRKVVYTPDLIGLMDNIAGLVEITSEGPMIAPGVDFSAKNAICLTLLGAFIGSKIGKLHKDSLSTKDLSKLTGKAKKTVRNEMPKLINDGLVERTADGEYRITEIGIRRTQKIAEEAKEKQVISQ